MGEAGKDSAPPSAWYIKALEQTGLAASPRDEYRQRPKRTLQMRLFSPPRLVTVVSFFRETAPRTIFQRVLDILKKSSRAVELACREPAQVDHLAASLQLITECFRCLRNACIECSVNQNSIRYRPLKAPRPRFPCPVWGPGCSVIRSCLASQPPSVPGGRL